MWYFLRNLFVPFVIWFGIIYLVGCFTAGTYDINQWTADSRYAAGGFILACGLITGSITHVVWIGEQTYKEKLDVGNMKMLKMWRTELETEYQEKMKALDTGFYR